MSVICKIDLNCIKNNFLEVKKIVKNVKIMPVVKCDAYGHGLIPVAKVLEENDADMLAVDNVDEALSLRDAGIKIPILVLGSISDNLDILETLISKEIRLYLFDVEMLESIKKRIENKRGRLNIHFCVNTGMSRLGFEPCDSIEIIKHIQQWDNIHIEGLCTHISDSDPVDKSFTYLQIQIFKDLISKLEKENIKIPIKHMANSFGILHFPESYFDMVRPGLLIYGYSPTDKSIHITPAMTIKTKIISKHLLRKGEGISYGRIYKAEKDTKIAVIPIGYHNGYNRTLSDKAFVLIRGKQYPVRGRVCMNFTMIDLNGDDYPIGEEVTVLNRDKLSARGLAKLADTIPYEIITVMGKLNEHVYI